MASTPFWLDDPMSLLRLDEGLWPFEAHINRAQRLNAATRLLLLMGTALSLYKRSYDPLLLCGLFVVFLNLYFQHTEAKAQRYDYSNVNTNYSRRTAPMYSSATVPPYQYSFNSGSVSQNATPPATHNFAAGSRPGTFPWPERSNYYLNDVMDSLYSSRPLPGGIPLTLPNISSVKASNYGNPMNNPGPFDFDMAVRSTAPVPAVEADNWLARLYNSPDNLPEGLFFYPVPDPTFMARHPFWSSSSEEDRNIVQDQCNYRVCR